MCGERIAFLCPANPRQKKRPTSKAISSVQELKRQQEVRKFRQMPPQEALKEAASLNLGLFLTQPSTEFLEGTGAVKELQQKFSKAAANFPELKTVASDFETFLAANSTTLKIPPTGRKPSGIYPVAAVFKFYPCEDSLRAFLQATKTLADTKDKTAIADAIAEARVDDQPHFNFFTNLALVSGDDGECDTRAVWFEFDLAAFVKPSKHHIVIFRIQSRERNLPSVLPNKSLRWKARDMKHPVWTMTVNRFPVLNTTSALGC